MLVMNNGHFTFYAKRPGPEFLGGMREHSIHALTEGCTDEQARARYNLFLTQRLTIVYED